MKNIEKLSNNIVRAFLKNKFISPLPVKYTKNMKDAQKFRKLCESKIKMPIIGYKAAGTGIPVLKKLGEKEPFYATVYKRNFLKNGRSVKINKYTMGIELEVCYKIKKNFFNEKKIINFKNIGQFISHTAPCIEIVGYRQKKYGIKYLGDLCSDFGANIKFIVGKEKKYKKVSIGKLKTKIENPNNNYSVIGNTNTVFVNPLNSLKFVLNKLKKDKIHLNRNFYVFTGSTVGIVQIKNKGIYLGKIDKIGTVKTKII